MQSPRLVEYSGNYSPYEFTRYIEGVASPKDTTTTNSYETIQRFKNIPKSKASLISERPDISNMIRQALNKEVFPAKTSRRSSITPEKNVFKSHS